MRVQLNDSCLFPAAPFLGARDHREGGGARGKAEDRLTDLVLTQDAQQLAAIILGLALKGVSPHLPSRSSYFWKE